MSKRKTFDEAPRQPDERACDWQGCPRAGRYRAPRARERLRDYYWFCMEHVRAYNSGWNYYAGMSSAEIDAERKRDVTWGRQTNPFSGLADDAAPADRTRARGWIDPEDLTDPLGILGAERRRRRREAARGRPGHGAPFPPGSAAARALADLDFEGELTPSALKAHYKALAKRYHPDLNGGCKAAEERLKSINEAYMTVQKALDGEAARP